MTGETWAERCAARELEIGRELTAQEAADLGVDLAAGDPSPVVAGPMVIDG